MPVMLAGTALVFLLYVMAAVISRRLYGVLFLLPQLLLSLLWLQYCHASSQPGHGGGPGEAFGLMLVIAAHAMLTVGALLAGVAVAVGRRIAGAGAEPPAASPAEGDPP